MLRLIILHTIQDFLNSLRFQIALVLVIFMYVFSSFGYINEYKEVKEDSEILAANEQEKMRNDAENSATALATKSRYYFLMPRNSGFVSSCNEEVIPNSILYSAFTVNRFEKTMGKTNPFLLPDKSVDWLFIIIILLSFLGIVFSYDSISGEKESRTLALCMSNSVSRGKLLLGKYLGINITLLIMLSIGSLISLVILSLSPAVAITLESLVETGIFMFFVFLFTLSISALGMFTSIITKSPKVSLLYGICIYLLFLFIIPNSALLFANQLFPVEKESVIAEKSHLKRSEIEAGYPDGKWSSRGGDLFYPKHEIRANMQMDFMISRQQIYHDWYNQLFNQYENTRKITWISPISVLEYGTESILDGGYYRFKKNWEDMNNYQSQFLAFFKAFDANDEESPHWYNPYENYSTTAKKVSFEEVPKYAEYETGLLKRFMDSMPYLLVLGVYVIVFLMLSFMKFMRYDLR